MRVFTYYCKMFLRALENKAGHSDRMILDQIDEGIAVYFGFELSRHKNEDKIKKQQNI